MAADRMVKFVVLVRTGALGMISGDENAGIKKVRKSKMRLVLSILKEAPLGLLAICWLSGGRVRAQQVPGS